MSQDALAVVEQFNEGVAKGEIRWNLIDPEIDAFDHDIPDAGAYRGHAGVRKWIEEDWGSAWESFTIEPEQVLEAGDAVVSIFTMVARGKGSGVETRRRNATVATVENGLITRLAYYTTEEEARAAAGLAVPGEA